MLDWETIEKGKKPLGRYGPWVWAVEFVRGCNFKCWHCSARVFPSDGVHRYMSRETWESMFKIAAECTPNGRLELGQCGEPTLHPELYEMLELGRKTSPTTQQLIHTNGSNVLSGKVSLGKMFDAGLNTVVFDVYSKKDWFVDLAKKSGAEWYLYDDHKIGSPNHRNAWSYANDPDMKLVVIRDCPEKRMRWRKFGRMSTFLNHIDWKVAMPKGLVPVRESYERKCTIPMRFSTVDYEGNYLFCCIDFLCESGGLLGNVKDGPEGFKRYWFGELMQSIRKRLHNKDRSGIPYCSQCNCAFSKCDWTGMWPEGSYDGWWDGEKWNKIIDDSEVFADGWKKKEAKESLLPTKSEEQEVLEKSSDIIVPSTIVAQRDRNRKGFGLK